MGDTIPVDLNSLPPVSELAWGGQHAHLWLWLPAFSSFLHPASPGWTGPDNHAHKAEGEGWLTKSPLIFAIHYKQQRGGEGWKKVRFGWAGCSPGGWEQQGEEK